VGIKKHVSNDNDNKVLGEKKRSHVEHGLLLIGHAWCNLGQGFFVNSDLHFNIYIYIHYTYIYTHTHKHTHTHIYTYLMVNIARLLWLGFPLKFLLKGDERFLQNRLKEGRRMEGRKEGKESKGKEK
jgi:hypothetical protein